MWSLLVGSGCGAASSDDESETTATSDASSESSESEAESAASETESSDSGDTGGAMCDPYLQDCPDGEKCLPPPPMVGGDPSCVPVVDDPAQDGSPCNFGPGVQDECGVGSLCLPTDVAEMVGSCIPMCTGSPSDPSCPSPTQVCSVNLMQNLCLEHCNPLDASCPGIRQCTPIGGWDFGCLPAGPMQSGAGASCGGPQDCAAGTVCMPASLVPDCAGESCCTEFCDLSETPASCSLGGQLCEAWNAATPPPGFENVGVCALPS